MFLFLFLSRPNLLGKPKTSIEALTDTLEELEMDDKARNNYLRDYEMFTALVERVSEGIFGFSSEDAYQRELNKEKHPSKKRKKFGRR